GNAEKILKLTVSSRLLTDERERERTQKVGEVFSAMGVKDGARVAEVGAGPGFFVVRLARAVGPAGRGVGGGMWGARVKEIVKRLQEDGIENVVVVHGLVDDPKLAAASLDAALISDAYHEMTKYEAMLAKIKEALKPGGRLVIVDRVRGEKRKEGSKRTRED